MPSSLLVRCSRLAKANRGNIFQLWSCSFSTATTTTYHDSPRRPDPPPIRVAITESAGRGVFATRGIGSGDLIHTAKPIFCHPSLSCMHTVCYFCLRKLGNLNNSETDVASFCSEECKERSKEFHDVEMKVNWMAFDDYCRTRGLKYPLLVKRLACMVISGVGNADSIDILQPARLTTEMIIKMEEGFELLRNALTKALIADENLACILHV